MTKLKKTLLTAVVLIVGALGYDLSGLKEPIKNYVAEKAAYVEEYMVNLQVSHMYDKLPVDRVVKISSIGGVCSGFKLKSNHVITARHCIKGLKDKYRVTGISQENNLTFLKYVLDFKSKNTDIAILKPEGTNVPLDTSEFEMSGLKYKQQLYILGTNGNTLLHEMKVRSFIVNSMSEMFYPLGIGEIVIGESFRILKGTSGAAMLNKEGKIVGIMSVSNFIAFAGFSPITELRREL